MLISFAVPLEGFDCYYYLCSMVFCACQRYLEIQIRNYFRVRQQLQPEFIHDFPGRHCFHFVD